MLQKENRLFASDSHFVAIGRVIFIKWMKEKGQWGKYMAYMRRLSLSTLNWEKDYYNKSWEQPKSIIDFLGGCSFDYNYTYKPWRDICNGYLNEMIISKVDKYEFTQSH